VWSVLVDPETYSFSGALMLATFFLLMTGLSGPGATEIIIPFHSLKECHDTEVQVLPKFSNPSHVKCLSRKELKARNGR
jgi:hypothetical protein